VKSACPEAMQVAERWHLMENASAVFLVAVRRLMRQTRDALGSATVNPRLPRVGGIEDSPRHRFRPGSAFIIVVEIRVRIEVATYRAATGGICVGAASITGGAGQPAPRSACSGAWPGPGLPSSSASESPRPQHKRTQAFHLTRNFRRFSTASKHATIFSPVDAPVTRLVEHNVTGGVSSSISPPERT